MPVPSPAPKITQELQEVPLKIVGGNNFGRYNKISAEETWNMIVSDGALVIYAGYKNVLNVSSNNPGRCIYFSATANAIFAVWGTQFYQIRASTIIVNSKPVTQYSAMLFGNLATSTGDVFMSENNNGEIAITDGVNIYVFNYLLPGNGLKQSGVDFGSSPFVVKNPGYISFQNGRLIVASQGTTNWYLSAFNDALTWTFTAQTVGSLQTKPDTIQAVVPVPGGGNNALVFGHNVIELWQDVGYALFPYQRQSTFNVDFGCLNASSIASLDRFVVWLGANEQSGATLMLFDGSTVKSISTDGIDFKLNSLTNPRNCTGFIFRQDGHLLYQFTFPDDNLSFVYDFNTQLFFTVTDENLNYHIARNVVFFNNSYYFVSLKGGNLYEFSTNYTDFIYSSAQIEEVPRIRIPPPIRLPSQRYFIMKSAGFTVENGQKNTIVNQNEDTTAPIFLSTQSGILLTTQSGILLTLNQKQVVTVNSSNPIATEAIDMSISRDGAQTYGTTWRLNMNPTGMRKSRLIWQRLGQSNDSTFQFKFNGFGRFVAFDGVVEVYQ